MLAALGMLPAIIGGTLHAQEGTLEAEIMRAMNRVRQDPPAYARDLEALLARFDGKVLRRDGRPRLETTEGPSAVREAISALRHLSPRPALRPAGGLAHAARDHVRDQGPRGGVGHTGSDGSTTAGRVSRYGTWEVVVSENIAYGPLTAREVVMQLVVDDGVPGRGHRRNLLDPDVRVAGVACGPHVTWGQVCVIDYAGGYTTSPAR